VLLFSVALLTASRHLPAFTDQCSIEKSYHQLQLCTVIYCYHLLQPSCFVVLLIAATDYCCDLLQLLLFCCHNILPCRDSMQCYMYHLLILFSATTHCFHRLQLSIATAIHCNYVLPLLNLLWHCRATVILYIHCHYYLQLRFSTTMYCCYAVLPVPLLPFTFIANIIYRYDFLQLCIAAMQCYRLVSLFTAIIYCYYSATAHCGYLRRLCTATM